MMKKSHFSVLLMKHAECVRTSGYRLISPKTRERVSFESCQLFFLLSHSAPNMRGTGGRTEAAHWFKCVAEDQREACINPMCQSGKNQAQLGSRTVEGFGEEWGRQELWQRAGGGKAQWLWRAQLTHFTASPGHFFHSCEAFLVIWLQSSLHRDRFFFWNRTFLKNGRRRVRSLTSAFPKMNSSGVYMNLDKERLQSDQSWGAFSKKCSYYKNVNNMKTKGWIEYTFVHY